MVPRTLFLRILFDEGMPFCYEDLDFTLKIKRLGYKVLTVPEAIVYHFKSFNEKPSFNPLRNYLCGRNAVIFHCRYGGYLNAIIRFTIELVQSGLNILKKLLVSDIDESKAVAYYIIGLFVGLYKIIEGSSCYNTSP